MTRDEISEMLTWDKRYSFLDKEPLVGNIILLGLGGSYAYGTNNEDSAIALREVARNRCKKFSCSCIKRGFVESKRDCGYTGIERDYPVSIKEVLDITAETGALETQARIRELKPYKHPITGKEAHCAGILLNVIKNVETPMLMCQAEKDIVERALRIVLGDL